MTTRTGGDSSGHNDQLDPEPLLDALRTGGRLGDYWDVALRAARSAVNRHNLPHPQGYLWDDDAYHDLVGEFFSSGRHAPLVARAADDAHLRRSTVTAFANMVRDELRKTEHGKLHRRIRTILEDGAFVEGPPGFWGLAVTRDPGAWLGDEAELVEASWNVDVTVQRWREDAQRAGPVADRPSFERLLTRVFGVASARVHIGVLVRVLGQRLGLGPLPMFESLDTPDADGDDRAPRDYSDGTTDVEMIAYADHIWDTQLTSRERRQLPYLDATVREFEDEVGDLKKSAAAVAMRRLREKMRGIFDELDEDSRAVVAAHFLRRSHEEFDEAPDRNLGLTVDAVAEETGS